MLMVVMFGVVSLQTIPVQLAPDVRKPIITVTTDWFGAAPAEVEREIEEPALETTEDEEPAPETGTETIIVELIEPEPEEESEPEPEPVEEELRKLRKSMVYFVDISDGGTVELSGHERTVYYYDSPLTETINALLKGPAPEELNMELLSLIPENTKLLKASVKKGTAYLDFNEAFTFNSFGVEGYVAQLSQIVYTATEFSTVEAVQFLIEGKKVDYLGPEGVVIGKPLSRESFTR